MAATRFYIQYTPLRRGLTGAEYVAEFIDSNFKPAVTWNEIGSLDTIHFGYLESENGDALAKALASLEGRFSAQRLYQDEFIGLAYLAYNPISYMPNETPIPFTDWLFNNTGISITEEVALENLKLYKRRLFKEVIRKKFNDYNDLSADITKSLVLLFVHYPNLTAEEKATVDNLLQRISAVYPISTSIQALQKLTEDLENILVPYYQKALELDAATTKDDILQINYV